MRWNRQCSSVCCSALFISVLALLLGISDSMSGKCKVSVQAKASILEAVLEGEKRRDVVAQFGTLQSLLSAISNSKDSVINSPQKGTAEKVEVDNK